MKKLAVLFLGSILALAPLTAAAFPPDTMAGKNCADCHKLDKKEADTLVKKLNPSLSAGEIRPAPVKGLWLIEVDAGEGKRGAVMLDFGKKHIIILSQLIPLSKFTKDYSRLPLADALVLGSKSAKKKIAVFTDPDCPACQQLHENMKQVTAKRKDIAFHLFLYPLPMHKDAPRKSRAILCEKNPHSLLDDAYAGKNVPDPKCNTDRVEKNIALGREMEIDGTPTLIRPDGTAISGAFAVDKLIEWVDGK